MNSAPPAKINEKKKRPRRAEALKYKYRVTDPFIFTYGCDLHHRPYTTARLKERKKVRKNFDPRRYSYRKDHAGSLYVPYQLPKGWEEVFDEESGEKAYFNTLTSTFQDEEPYEEANIDDLFTSIYDIDIQLGSTLPSRYPRYLNSRAAAFVEDLEIIENNYRNRIISRKEYFQKFHELLSSFDYKRGITYICPLCDLELFDGLRECTNEDCIKKVAIMRKGDVHADQWMPYVKPKIEQVFQACQHNRLLGQKTSCFGRDWCRSWRNYYLSITCVVPISCSTTILRPFH